MRFDVTNIFIHYKELKSFVFMQCVYNCEKIHSNLHFLLFYSINLESSLVAILRIYLYLILCSATPIKTVR